MADNPETPEKKTAPAAEKAPKKRGGKLGFFLIMITFGAAFPLIMPTALLVLIGMLPTLVALLTDNDDQKSSTAAVGAMNFAGVVPFIIDLWTKGQTMQNVFLILREPSNWLIMLGSAAIGQLIVFAIPHAIATLSLARAEGRLKILKDNLESLKSSWGPEVGTTKPLDKIGH